MNRRRPGRHGKSLIELLVVLSFVGVILTMSGGLLTTLFRNDEAQSKSLQATEQARRLADQFRQDVREARTVEQKPPEENERSGRLILQLPEQTTIEYVWDPAVVRSEKKSDETESRVRIPIPASSIVCRLDKSGERVELLVGRVPRLLASPLKRDDRETADPPKMKMLIFVSATVGLHRRFEEATIP